MKPGDLVRYVRNPIGKPPNRRNVIPNKPKPVGIVIEIISQEIGTGETKSLLEIILVRWSEKSWNISKGVSEEFREDLELIQSACAEPVSK
jgi:hypothetical protein